MDSSLRSNKQEISSGYTEMLAFVRSLAGLDRDLWLAPLKPGKWSIAETIAHLLYWDRFILKERLPVMQAGAVLPQAGIDLEAFNGEAARYAREEASQEEVIQTFCEIREMLLDEISKRSEKEISAILYTASQKQTSLYSYFQGMIEHDRHHLEPMKQFILNRSN